MKSLRACILVLCGGPMAFAADCPPALLCQTRPERCEVDPRTKQDRKRPEEEPLVVTSDDAERSADGNVVWRDNVEVRQGDRVLRADEVEYEAATEDFRIPGSVTLSDPNLTLSGEGAHIDPKGTAQFDNATFEIPARAGHGSAARIRISQEGEAELRDVRYTTCPTPNPAWEMRVARLHVDPNARIGTGTGIRVDFKGIPILYTPYISFPVGDEPKTGLLPPEFGQSSQSGWSFALPWYWRISDQYDATFTPTWYTTRGIDAGAEFRLLTEESRAQITTHYLPNDRLSGEDRSFVEALGQTNFTPRLRLTAVGVNLGDRAWFEDFGGGIYTSIVALPRTAELVYRSDEWSLLARAQNFQMIDPLIPRADQPFTLLPQMIFEGYFPDRWLGLTARLDGEFVAFRRSLDADTSINSQRLDLRPELRLPLRGNAIYFEPAAALRYTAYRLDSNLGFTDDRPTRAAPIASVEGGMIFERESHSSRSNRERVQTFEPRFLYAYVPYRDQNNLPVFDTAPPDFNLIQLFETERYAGPDRLGDVNHIALGATSRLIGEDGRQVLSATIGELYRFASQRVTLPGETPERRGSSDVIGELDLAAYRNWAAHIGVQWDPSDTRTERTEFSFQYRPASDQVINVGYRYRRRNTLSRTRAASVADGLKQVDTSAAWPLGSMWSLYGRFVYSLQDHAPIERLGGFEYRSCCWNVRLLARRSVSSLTGNSNWEIKAQLELTGLSKVGNPVDTFLAQSIPGYSAARNDFSSTPISLPGGSSSR